MRLIFTVIIFLFLTSCKIDKDKKVDREKFTFKTGDDTALFFKNIRQSYYDLEENKAAKFNIFRLEDRVVSEDKPILNLAIVNNFMDDEAYLLVEPNDSLQAFDPLKLKAKTDTLEFQITLENINRTSMLEFASKVYEGLLANAEFYVIADDKEVPIFTTKEEREAFRITTSDYYRLTRIY